MHTLLRVSSALALVSLFACGSGSSGSGATASGTTSSSSSGESTMSSSSSGASTSSSTSSSGMGGKGSGGGGAGGNGSGGAGGGPSPCTNPHIDISIDKGPTKTLSSSCAWDPDIKLPASPQAYVVTSNGMGTLVIEGCASGDPNAQGVVVQLPDPMGTGTFTTGAAHYIDDMGVDYGKMNVIFIADVTKYGPKDSAIDGDFTADVQMGMKGHEVHGLYHLCRGPDIAQ